MSNLFAKSMARLVGAPTSLAIDLANKFDMTLIGFVKRDGFNIYTNNKKVNVD